MSPQLHDIWAEPHRWFFRIAAYYAVFALAAHLYLTLFPDAAPPPQPNLWVLALVARFRWWPSEPA